MLRWSFMVALVVIGICSPSALSEENGTPAKQGEPLSSSIDESQVHPNWKPHTLFTFKMTANQTFFEWFGARGGKSVAATVVLGKWKANLELLINQYGDIYETVDLRNFMGRLDNLIVAVEDKSNKIGSFRDLILEQNTNSLKDAVGTLLPELDLGFLQLNEEQIRQFRAMLFRETTLHNYTKGAARFKSGIGSFTIEEMYHLPASPENIGAYEDDYPRGKDDPNADDQDTNGKLGNTNTFSLKKECDDIGDIVTVLNMNRILWKAAFAGDPDKEPDSAHAGGARMMGAAASTSGNNTHPCCCNNAAHPIEVYRKCWNRGVPGSTCTMCSGSCCLASVTWCGILHFLH